LSWGGGDGKLIGYRKREIRISAFQKKKKKKKKRWRRGRRKERSVQLERREVGEGLSIEPRRGRKDPPSHCEKKKEVKRTL